MLLAVAGRLARAECRVRQELRNQNLSLRPKRSVRKQSQSFRRLRRYRLSVPDMLRKRNEVIT
ncbi:hypothetical protein IQ243_00365 [Nostocales cyanobacterium LEGE 11386]|nr:hypothetical protein [Nostocales cyanobacterium LEGE 11386]